MKTRLAALLITLSFNALAGDNIIQQQLKLQQNLMRIQQQNQQYLMPDRHEERREQYQQPYYNPPYYGNGGHEGGNFGSNSRHYSRGLGRCPKITCTTLYERENGVVPFTMKICLLDLDFFELLIGHLNSFWINVSVKFGLNFQPRPSGRPCDQIDDHFMAN